MRWGIAGLLSLLLLLGIATPILGASSRDVTVTATGYVCDVPGGLMIIYISDFELGLIWTKGENTEHTMVRAKDGSAPTSRTDGSLVYYGDGTCASDTGVDFQESPRTRYYRAWSQNANGVWEETGTTNFKENPYVELIAKAVFIIGISGLALYAKSQILYIGTFVGLVLFGYQLSETTWLYSIPVFVLACWMIFKGIVPWVRG